MDGVKRHPVELVAGVAGLDADQLLQAVGVDGAYDRAAWGALWAEAARVTDDPAIALHMPEHVPFGSYPMIDYLAGSHGTVGAGIRAMVEHFRFAGAPYAVELEERSDRWLLRLRRRGLATRSEARLHRTSTEYALGMILSRFRFSSGRRFTPRRALFAFPKPAYADAYARFFGCALVFSAPFDGLEFGPEVIGLRQERADHRLRKLLETSAAALKEHLPADTVSERLRQALRKAVGDGPLTASTVAQTLGMSARTLQRRLEDEGTTFQRLVDGVRFDLAQRYLSDTAAAPADVAYRLGYSCVRAFSRAFKRWSGTTPTHWQHSGPSPVLHGRG